MPPTPWGGALPAPDLLALLIPVVVVAPAAQPGFAPPSDVAFRHVMTEQREHAGVTRRFEIERRVIFHATAAGFDADVTLVRVDQSAGQPGKMFMAGVSALKDHTIRFRLDPTGAVRSIDDEDAVWSAFCDGVEAMTAGSGERRRAALPFVAPLRAMPPERRRAMLASMVASLVAGPIGTLGSRPVQIEARGPGGEKMMLEGQERRDVAKDGVTIVTEASGTLPLPAATTKMVANVSVAMRRRVDPATGLVVRSEEVRTTEIGFGTPGAAREIATTTSVLMRMVS